MTIAALALCTGMSACTKPIRPLDKPTGETARHTENLPVLPLASDVVAAYNARVADISSLRTPVTIIIDRPDEDGAGRAADQVEGSLQVEMPGKLSLRIDKVGQTLAYLGSDGTRYWWINVGEERVAYVGLQSAATMEKSRAVGIAVHPLDLIEMLCITPLPADSKIAWAKGAKYLLVATRGRFGRRVHWLDPATYEPVRVALGNEREFVAMSATLERSASVPVEGKGVSSARMPTLINISIPGERHADEVRVGFRVIDPSVQPSRIKAAAFDLAALKQVYRVKEVVDLDAQRVDAQRAHRADAPATPSAGGDPPASSASAGKR